jgi:hypothetical protein
MSARLAVCARPLWAAAFALLSASCDNSGPPKNPFEPPADAPKPVPATSAAPAPQGPPDFEIDAVGPKVGFSRAVLEVRDGRQRLASDLAEHKQYIDGQNVKLRVDRKAKLTWVNAYLDELAKLGATKVVIRTETRKEFSPELTFKPELKAGGAPPCSVVGMVMADYGTAVWKLGGGVAGKRGKGMAGPDLSMTSETIERLGKACAESNLFFVSVADGIDWGLAYDLAASAKALTKIPFSEIVLLGETPVPGHKVALRK